MWLHCALRKGLFDSFRQILYLLSNLFGCYQHNAGVFEPKFNFFIFSTKETTCVHNQKEIDHQFLLPISLLGSSFVYLETPVISKSLP